MKKFLSLMTALALSLSLCIPTLAANNEAYDGDTNANSDVTFQVVNSCTHDNTSFIDNGDNTHRKTCNTCGQVVEPSLPHIDADRDRVCNDCNAALDVHYLIATVPLKLPILMDIATNNITVPTDAVIENNVEDKTIAVKAIKLVTNPDWTIADPSTDFTAYGANASVLGMYFRSDKHDTSGDFTLSDNNWNIAANKSLNLNMAAKIPAQTTKKAEADIATASFVLTWATNPNAITSDSNTGADTQSQINSQLPKTDVTTTGEWKQTTMPLHGRWYDAVYGDGKFVTVTANSNKAAYSIDGKTWTESTLPLSAAWHAVTYGDGRFVAIAHSTDKAAYSTDGINWTATTLPASAVWREIAYGNGKFVTVEQFSTRVAYSEDGITWTTSTLPSSVHWNDITYGGGKFVTTGFGSNQAAYSEDGITWTVATLPSSSDWEEVVYGNDRFVVISRDDNQAAYSTDGINWTATTLPLSADWTGITYGNGQFTAVANNSDTAIHSKDGITWTTEPLPTSAPWSSVAYGSGKLVVVADGSSKALYKN